MILALAAIALVLFPLPAFADDTVHFALTDGSTQRLTGEITEYTGQGLRLRRVGGREEKIDAARIIQVETTWSGAAMEAERLYAAGKADDALPLYRKAVEEESRRWARRELVAKLIRCYHQLNRVSEAVQLFQALYKDDPLTPHFHVIPLAWTVAEPSASLVDQAAGWLRDTTNPVTPLLGASWLLASGERAAASDTLRGLAASQDVRVACLADTQLWRVSWANVDPLELDRWQAKVEQMPGPLRAGPQLVLGQALAQAGRSDTAALTWMHLPILYPGQRQLAAQGLLEAARQLEQAERTSQAWTLYREIVSDYHDTTAAALAARRLEQFAQ